MKTRERNGRKRKGKEGVERDENEKENVEIHFHGREGKKCNRMKWDKEGLFTK